MESDFSIIENSIKAQNEYGHNYGSSTYYISKEDIQALLDGKQLATAINGGEYSLFIILGEEEKKEPETKGYYKPIDPLDPLSVEEHIPYVD